MEDEFGLTAETRADGRVGQRTPLEKFILDQRELLKGEANTWAPVKSHTKLLVDAAHGRRISVRKIGTTHVLSRSGVQIGGVDDGITTLVSHQAMRAASSRELARQCFALSGIPTLAGRTLHVSQAKKAAAFLDRVKQPVSVRPSSVQVHSGAGVNLSTSQQLSQAWEDVSHAVADLPAVKQQIEVETFLPWLPLRVFVVSEEVVAAVARVPLYVVGDGEQTMGELADAELQRRNACDYLSPVEEGEMPASRDGLDVDRESVLPEGTPCLLTHDRRGQMGAGWSIDVTDRLAPELTELAVNATWALPGLGATAVDILTPSLSPEGQAVVSGIAPKADLREFRYPTYGRSRLPNRYIMRRLLALGTNLGSAQERP